MHHLLTPISFEPSEPCALCTKADMATTAERRQPPPIGHMARMVLDPMQGLGHDGGIMDGRPLSSLVCYG